MINYFSGTRRQPFLITFLFSLLASSIGIITLIGWILTVPSLTSFNSRYIPMAPSSALLLIMLGCAILFHLKSPRDSRLYKTGIILSSTYTLLSLILFILSSFEIRLDAEHLGFKIDGSINGAPFGHISPLSAFCLFLIGLSFLFSYSRHRKLLFTAFIVDFIIILASVVLLLAHLFGMPLFYGTQFIPPALPTSFAFFFLGIALIVLISSKIRQHKNETDITSSASSVILFMVFTVLAVGIISAGYFYYRHLEKEFRSEKEEELSSVAKLKVSELIHIRNDLTEDVSLFYRNTIFSTLVYRYFRNPNDIKTYHQLRNWMNDFKLVKKYNNLCLHDAQGAEKINIINSPNPHSSTINEKFEEVIKSGKITFVDFYRNDNDQHIYLSILVPIFDPQNSKHINGVLSLHMDPEEYLYPYVKEWPTPSKSSETLIVRREGNDVVFLNELKLKQNVPLLLRISLERKNVPAVKAVLGKEGIVEGYDYRNVEVLADVHHIPDSPWFIVTKTDMTEVYAPLNERLWLMIFLITALLFGSGTSVAFVWRNQHIRFTRERVMASEALRDSYELLEKVFSNTHIMMAYLDTEFNFIRVNNAFAEADERTPDFYSGKNHFALFPYEDNENLFRKVVETGQPYIAFAKPFEYAEHPERGISFWDWSLQPVKASDGSVYALILSKLNVTDRIKSQQNVQKLNRVYALLSNINQAIVRIHDVDQLFNEICRIVTEDGKFRMVWIGMINQKTKIVDIAASAGVTEDYLNTIKIDLNDENQIEGPTLKTLRYGNYTITNDIANDENMNKWRENALKHGYRSSASFPIKVLGTMRGVIKLYSSEVGFFDEEEIELLDEMSMDVSFALEFIEQEAKRKQAEEFLLKFRMGIERSGDAVFLTDPDGTIVYVNPAFENIFGYTKEEAIGKTPRILKSDTYNQEYYKNLWNEILSKKSIAREIINKTKDGRLLTIEASINPIINEQGEIIGHLAVERDITEKKIAEQALSESEDRFRDLVENSSDLICTHDLDGKILSVNKAALQITGYSEEEVLKMNMQDILVPEYRRIFKAYLAKIYHTGKAHGLMTIQSKTGERRIWEYNNTLRTKGVDKPIVRGMVKDITEHKRAELLQNAVYKISQSADKNVTLDDLYKSVHEIISTIMPARNFYISLFDEKQNLISFPYFVDEFDVPSPPSKPGRGLTEYVLRTSKPLFCDAATDKELRMSGEVELIGEPSAIWIGVPLIVGNKTIGVMVVQHYSDPKPIVKKNYKYSSMFLPK